MDLAIGQARQLEIDKQKAFVIRADELAKVAAQAWKVISLVRALIGF